MAPPIDLDHLLAQDWWSKVDRSPDPDACWLWKKSTGSHGYGQCWDGITVRLAHRCAWELTNGRIPDELTIDHECRVRTCCNPAHLRLLSNEENGRDNGWARRTECPKGHAYDLENTYVGKDGRRRCRRCNRERMRGYARRPAVTF